jgi:AhpD family alkylhydroperoxidase
MQPRMKQPVYFNPEAMQALLALGKSAEGRGVPATTLALVHLRASQINGCATCLEAHLRLPKDTDERMLTIAAWRDAPFFTEAERAALALTDAVTRLADRDNPVPDEVWAEAARHYDEAALANLLISISTINVWNRFNVATRQVAGANKW